ncbi:MAG: prepilin-type N-terminal cleavage/methylation domain-containing protein [Candidatus Abyssobacteria bacterium SURF_5]|uniref:Prepilin-type N-terminal cleavage/methylation domain-containing protein n=1 Tax=Abyssobacteria bacterium (strain SURF_5) TaxID=2093360 RepID=A0A3A4NXY9_ABYX5|nr:MAG: prepilin-type N-terminal cleavage/methylation domain-containing protein [Candidatus Abyssubacteria bacterium SURF_5]
MKSMLKKSNRQEAGFTLIEVAVSIGVLGALSLVITALLLRTLDTYGQIMSDTDTIKQARYSLNMVSREIRESVNLNFADVVVPGDALILASARNVNNDFVLDGPPFVAAGPTNTFDPIDSSIILLYINTSADGIPQLVRHQLYYAQDLNLYVPPFNLVLPDPYSGTDILIVDSAGTQIAVNMTTGAVAGTAPTVPPKILMNRVAAFDLALNVAPAPPFPLNIFLTCQVVDRYGRTATSRFQAQADPRNT